LVAIGLVVMVVVCGHLRWGKRKELVLGFAAVVRDCNSRSKKVTDKKVALEEHHYCGGCG